MKKVRFLHKHCITRDYLISTSSLFCRRGWYFRREFTLMEMVVSRYWFFYCEVQFSINNLVHRMVLFDISRIMGCLKKGRYLDCEKIARFQQEPQINYIHWYFSLQLFHIEESSWVNSLYLWLLCQDMVILSLSTPDPLIWP